MSFSMRCRDCGEESQHPAETGLQCPACGSASLRGPSEPTRLILGDGGFDGPAGGPVYQNIYAPDGENLEADIVGTVTAEDLGEAVAHGVARRVVASYNAAAGIEVSQLEGDVIGDLIEAARGVLSQTGWPSREAITARNKLLAAVRRAEPSS